MFFPYDDCELSVSIRILILLFVTAVPAFGADAPIRVAVFMDSGVGPSSENLIAALKSATDEKFEIIRISAEAIRQGELEAVNVLVHPGGSGSKQGKALGETGRDAVRKYVREGGGVLGVCGSAYLATNDYSWSLNLIDAKVVDRKHWARGTGTVTLQLSPKGSEFFQHAGDELSIHYGQVPLLARREWDDPELPDYESLAIYTSEIANNGAPNGVMAGTSAAVRCEFGSGRVFCFSPHPELTEGQHHLIPLAVNWLAARKPMAENR